MTPQLPNTPPPVPVQTLSYFNPIDTTSPAAWRRGNILIIAQGAILPDRCVKCNIPTENLRYRQQITWYPWYLLLFFLFPPSLIVLLILYLIFRKQMKIDIGVCRRHRRQRRLRILAAVITTLAGAYVTIFGTAYFNQLIATAGTVLMAAAVLIGSSARILRPTQIDKTHGYFRGASPDFLDTLPGLPPPPPNSPHC